MKKGNGKSEKIPGVVDIASQRAVDGAAEDQNLRILITFDMVHRKVSVEGAINDKTLAFGMLEVAKDAIRQFIDSRANMPQTLRPGTFQS